MSAKTWESITIALNWIATGWNLLFVFEMLFCKEMFDDGFERAKILGIGIILVLAGLIAALFYNGALQGS